jgi:DMSO reductase anchor subunit
VVLPLVLTLYAAVGAILLAEAIWMAIDHTVLRDGHKFLVVWAICLWTAGLLIAPLNVILCFRAFRPIWIARKSQHSNRALMSAIQVETIIERFAEGDMEDKEDMVNLDQRSPAMVSFNTVKHDSMDKI